MDSQHQRSPVEFNQSCLQGSILLLCRNEGIMISKSFSAMNSVIPNYCAKKALFSILALLRFFIFSAAMAMILIELREAYLFKDILHLALFSIFFLVCSLQIAISRHKDIMKSKERAGHYFLLALFSMAAAFLELVDLGFDQLINRLRGVQSFLSWYQGICILESIFGIIAIMIMAYSLDRMLASLRLIAIELKAISL